MNLNALPFVTLLLLLVILSGRIFFLRKKGIHAGSGNRKKNSKLLLFIPVFFLIFLFWLFEIIRATFNISFLILPRFLTDRLFQFHVLQIVAGVSLLFSVIVFSITLKDFGASLRFELSEENPGPLITSGIFRISRNPFFLSLVLYLLGTALLLPSVFFIAFTLTAIIVIHFFILKEERFLTKIHGKNYLDYKQQVRRYF